jgi:SRSO17 transposase
MDLRELKATQQKLKKFVEEFKGFLGRSERVHWCQLYLSGLLLDGERKSIQPIAERLPGGNEQAMQQFVNQSPWDHEGIQLQLAQYLAFVFSGKKKKRSGVLVLDDTTLPKKGNHSVGVSRQYCGALGKVANCQSIVTWHYVGRESEHFPIVGELYLPENWTQDKRRLKRCRVPKKRFSFQKKWELANDLLKKIPKESLPYEAIVCDAGYGEIKEFLRVLDEEGQVFLAQVPESHGFWPKDVALYEKQPKVGRPRKFPEVRNKALKPLSAKRWRIKLQEEGLRWKTIKLPLASKRRTRAIAIRVKEVITQAYYRPGKEFWLIIENYAEDQYKYYVSNASVKTSLKKMILWAHERYKVEQGYQQLKEELGLDHFEGRSWQGLHHHMTLCFMAYGFLLLLKQQQVKKTQPTYHYPKYAIG